MLPYGQARVNFCGCVMAAGRRWMRGATCAAVFALAPVALPQARADAFLEPPGETKIALIGRFERAPSAALRDGTGALRGYSKFTLSAFAEHGLDARTTLIATKEASFLQEDGDRGEAFGAVGVGARRLLFDAGALQAAAQVLVMGGGGLEGRRPDEMGASADLRLALGWRFSLADAPAFAVISAGPRFNVGNWRGYRVDLTLGVRPTPQLLALVQIFNQIDDAAPLGPRGRAHRLKASVIYDLGPRWSVQVGAFTTIAVHAQRRQHGAMAGIIRRL
jgi:hypothetical protein